MTPLTIDEAIDLIRDQMRLLAPEQVPLMEASGRILRETVVAAEDFPPFDRSSVDGFAVLKDERNSLLTIVDTIRPGEMRGRQVLPGEAVRIFTGAALPGPGLRVIMQEDTRHEGSRLQILRWDDSLNIRFRGEDVKQGRTLLESGQCLESGQLALLASSGHAQVLVTRGIKVLHLMIGDELADPSVQPAPGQIRDCNSVMVDAFVRQNGGETGRFRLPEDYRQASRMINPAELAGVDLLLVSGGASVGEHDFTEQLLVDLGFEIQFRRLKARPGRPLIFGAQEEKAAFGLPGNPLAHFVCLHLFVAQAFCRMRGLCQDVDFKSVALAEPMAASPATLDTLWPARLEWGKEGLRAHPLTWRSSGDITCLAMANCLIRLPSQSAQLPPGALVSCLLTNSSIVS